MPTMGGQTTLLTGTSNTNVLLGLQYELAPFDCTIEVGVMSSRSNTTMALASGPDILAQAGTIVPFSGTAGTTGFPKYPDDYHWEDEAAAGDRISLGLSNPDAATAVVNWFVRVTPR